MDAHDRYTKAIESVDNAIFIKKFSENIPIFPFFFKQRPIFISACFHNGYVDGLITTTLMNKSRCNTMKTSPEKHPVGRYVNRKPGNYIRAGFD
jgi:hypothetical protein